MKLRLLIVPAILVVLLLLILQAVWPEDDRIAVPAGPQALEGVLTPVPLSLGRRGTHLLRSDGTDQAFVESTRVNLRDFEGLRVTVEGLMEPNIDPLALPVLVASGVTLRTEPVRSWTVQPLHLTLESPVSWEGEAFDDGMRFTAEGSDDTLLMVYRAGLNALPPGTRMQVGGRTASVVADAGSRTAFVQTGSGVVAFSFMSARGAGDALTPEQMLILRSVRFPQASRSSAPSAPPSVVTGTGAAPFLPCGGPAGVLCPDGSYCEITDPAEGIGQCRRLR